MDNAKKVTIGDDVVIYVGRFFATARITSEAVQLVSASC